MLQYFNNLERCYVFEWKCSNCGIFRHQKVHYEDARQNGKKWIDFIFFGCECGLTKSLRELLQ